MNPVIVSILLLFAGFACIFLELVVPSAGLIAIISGSLLISGIVIGFNAGMVPGMVILISTLIALPVVIAMLLKIWPKTPIGKRLFISPPTAEDVEPDREKVESLQSLVGKTGVARSKLLPAGGITIEGRHFDAVSDGLPIEQGQKISVVSVKAQRIFVRPILQADPETGNSDILSQSVESLGLDSLEDPLDG